MSNGETVDITPHPAILQVLGEIEFQPWQCVAELIDNSIDGFLERNRAGTPIVDPTVQVAFGRDTAVVKDNGPGMSREDLTMAVKAGWTSHERFGNLGLYGVGFNIATARLGSLTTIWTTRDGDDVWHGLDLDLQSMARGGSYHLPPRTRTKSNSALSGTEIEISGIKSDWRDILTNPNWVRANVTNRLSRVYGTMLRDTDPAPIGFRLLMNDRRVSAWAHCAWPADWDVYRRDEGLVRPIQEIDVTFGTRRSSRVTGEFYGQLDDLPQDEIVEIPERIYGWIGVQRYADEKEFGLDILRNGRKIEVGNKDIFDWDDATEYPIDDPRRRGRIVGEIHLDHGYVHYTKHRFEREHSSWTQLLQAVRHNEPLTKRSDHGLTGVNTSPLGLLFRTFRRNAPSRGNKWQDILFIKDNERAKQWARKYRRGDPEYLDDVKWREELEVSDASPIPPEEDGTVDGTDIGEDDGSDGHGGLGIDEDETEEPLAEPVARDLVPELSWHIMGIGSSGRAYDVETYAVESRSDDGTGSAWRSRPTERGVFEIEIHLGHPAFNSTSLHARDAVLADVAHYIASEESAVGAYGETSYGNVLVALRNRHATTDSLEANTLRAEIEDLRARVSGCLSRALSEEERTKLLRELPKEDVARVKLASAQAAGTAPVTSYLEARHLAKLFHHSPTLFFQSGCFAKPWTPEGLADNESLLEEYRKRLTQDIWMPLAEMGEFTDQTLPSPPPTRSCLALVRACVNRTREFLARD